MPPISPFDRALRLYLLREGVDTDDPNDEGGLTRWGIAQAYHPELDVANMTRDDMVEFYRRVYWARPGFDRVAMISERIAMKLFDIGGSQGVGRAERWLQSALKVLGHNIAVDGVIGKRTLEALEMAVDEGHSAKIMDSLRMLSLDQRIDRIQIRPDQVGYFKGWVLRSLDLDGRFT